jgi:glycosyltransferase involved in cell wall biosynthesis
MKNRPLVSVIIPTYDRADKIGAAIKSVMAQTYSYIQLIVIDDGSNDHTAEVVREFPDVEYYLQPHAGQAAARNEGLQWAKGTLIASLDSDDIWHPDFLMQCVNKLENDKLDFVFANWIQLSRDNTSRNYLRTYPALVPFIKNARNNWVDLDQTMLKDIYLKGCPSPSSSALMRKSSIVSGWNREIYIGDDWCIFLDMILRKSCKASFCLEQLWTKNVSELNVYDGRAWNEVTELLYVNDLQKFIIRYRHLLEQDEIKSLKTLHQKGLLNLAIYYLFKKGHISRSLRLIWQSFNMDAGQTFKIFPNTLIACLSRKLNTISFFSNTKLSTQE